jgi:Ca2+:H+ antiporter
VTLGHLSEEIAVILAIAYALSLFFSLRTHRHLMGSTEEELPTTGDNHQPEWNVRTSTIVLLLATAGVAWMAEILVGAVEHAAVSLGMNGVFVGVIVIAIVGNAAEHSTAVLMAWKNKMDLSMNIAIGSGIQVALFIAPVLVLASVLMGHDPIMDLHFSPLEVVSVVIAVVVLGLITPDGETNWMEGVLLLAVYIILALAFYNLPITSLATPTPSH